MNLRDITTKIRSINNTAKITNAMQMVSASKMRKVEDIFNQIKIQREALQEILKYILQSKVELTSKLLENRSGTSKKVLVVLVGTDRGLVGSLLSKLGQKYYAEVSELKRRGYEVEVLTLKKKALNLANRFGIKSDYHFDTSIEEFDQVKLGPIRSLILEKYFSGYEAVYVLYTKFITNMVQEPVIETLLPFKYEDLLKEEVNAGNTNPFLFEPSAEEVVTELLEQFLTLRLVDLFLNSAESEYAARMLTMSKASDNAKELEKDLTLDFNKTRQAAITVQLQENINAALV